MEKTYLLKGLDCPHCAGKIERGVTKQKGIRTVSLNLMKQTLTIEAESLNSDTAFEMVERIVHNYEPDVTVTELSNKPAATENDHKGRIIRLGFGAAVFMIGILFQSISDWFSITLLIAAYLFLGLDVLIRAARNIIKGRVFDENFLMSLSTVGAFVIGEYPEAVAVMLYYQIGELFQDMAVHRSRRSIAQLMNIRPDTAALLKDGALVTVSPETVEVGQCIVVRPGERIPLDGVIRDGESTIDTSALTGESKPTCVAVGDGVLSGCVNQSGKLTIQVTKPYGESTVAKILDLVENASSRKAPAENFITTFARYYTPVVVILAALLAVIPPLFLGAGWVSCIRRAFVYLVISCPCALVISVPLAFFGGIGAASRHGILIKGSNYLEALNDVKTVVFDKTGTLTMGAFRVSQIAAENGFDQNQVLAFAAAAEHHSNHPIGRSILQAYDQKIDETSISAYKEIPGQGISAVAGGDWILAGNGKLMESRSIRYTPNDLPGSKVYVAVNGVFAGCITVADAVKHDSKAAIANLKRMGIEKTAMLTGDDDTTAKAVAQTLNIDEYHARLLPDQKVDMLERMGSGKRSGTKLAFVGDGINDAPVLARADVGIAMGALGSDAAIEAADVVLMTDEPSKLVDAIRIARATKRIVVQNIVFALGIKIAFLIQGAFGIAGMWEAVFADVGVALLAVLNSLRMLRFRA